MTLNRAIEAIARLPTTPRSVPLSPLQPGHGDDHMKKWTFALALVIASATAVSAQLYGTQQRNSGFGMYGTGSNPSSHQADGYTRNNGTYVAPHYQTNPNNTQMDNYGTRGNQNPYTGQYGTRRPRY